MYSYTDGLHKIRAEKYLMEQIKQENKELINLIKKSSDGKSKGYETDKILQKVDWINMVLKNLDMSKINNIEGISWGQIIDIKKEVINVQRKIGTIDTPGMPGVSSVTALGEPTTPLLTQKRGKTRSSTGKPVGSNEKKNTHLR